MRHVYLVTYDICDPKRLRQVFKTMRGFGDHLQFSVFRCELSDTELLQLKVALRQHLDHDDDQVLFANLGPAEGRSVGALDYLGRALGPPLRASRVV